MENERFDDKSAHVRLQYLVSLKQCAYEWQTNQMELVGVASFLYFPALLPSSKYSHSGINPRLVICISLKIALTEYVRPFFF